MKVLMPYVSIHCHGFCHGGCWCCLSLAVIMAQSRLAKVCHPRLLLIYFKYLEGVVGAILIPLPLIPLPRPESSEPFK